MKFRRSMAVVLVLIFLSVLLPAGALAATSGPYKYTVSGGKATITEYTGSAATLSVPTKLGGYPVTGIGEMAFYENERLKSVALPAGILKIGANAFGYCTKLTQINIPSELQSIGDYAFTCTGIKTVTLPASLKNIGEGVFCLTTLESVKISKGITEIGASMFAMCPKLKTISVPASVRRIGGGAFSLCQSLERFTIPKGVTKIENDTFEGCESLTRIDIPDSVTSFGRMALSGCNSLTQVHIPKGVTLIDESAFDDCNNLKSIQIPSTVRTIGLSAFSYCTKLKSVVIPKGVKRIEMDTFRDCTALKSVTIPSTVTYIGERAFRDCPNLRTLVIPASVKAIEKNAFIDTQVTLRVYSSSGAYNYARANKIHYVLIHRISARVNNAAYGSVKGSGEYDKGKTATLTAIPKPGCRFIRWTQNGKTVTKNYQYKLKTAKNVTLTAEFGKIGRVSIGSVTSAETGRIKITWKKVAEAQGYQVYRSTNKYDYTKISSTSSTSLKNSGLKAGKTYYYKVRAYNSAGKVVTTGAFSAVRSAIAK